MDPGFKDRVPSDLSPFVPHTCFYTISIMKLGHVSAFMHSSSHNRENIHSSGPMTERTFPMQLGSKGPGLIQEAVLQRLKLCGIPEGRLDHDNLSVSIH